MSVPRMEQKVLSPDGSGPSGAGLHVDEYNKHL